MNGKKRNLIFIVVLLAGLAGFLAYADRCSPSGAS